ncbi:hypothetical protein [Microvirga solisilvae]|uniref:hypothetical protein n=1 Tax=Microvirga solisilvae TaxID=2919498 RepID=UPI001FB0354B|nr:hypothetical protein [Microvirga solisilvae]
MLTRVQERIRSILQHTATRVADRARLPAVVVDDVEVILGLEQSQERPAEGRHTRYVRSASITPEEPDSSKDMSASVDTLAEQMLTLVDIVSAQEKDIKALKEQCRKLEEHNQAVMVAFSAFFHVLSVGRVAKASEITSLLQNISKIAEQEGRPKESVAFLQELARMVPGHSDAEPGA